MAGYQLAQLNIGVIKGAMDSPVMADFAANLDRINALAESMPGFVWRLQTSLMSNVCAGARNGSNAWMRRSWCCGGFPRGIDPRWLKPW
jgi:hypothetical protein